METRERARGGGAKTPQPEHTQTATAGGMTGDRGSEQAAAGILDGILQLQRKRRVGF